MTRWTREPMIVPAAEVQQGDFLPGIGDGYVIDVDPDFDLRDQYNCVFASGSIMITFNDADGDEDYLIVGPTVPVTIRRDEMI